MDNQGTRSNYVARGRTSERKTKTGRLGNNK
jgi:hypothetical protein